MLLIGTVDLTDRTKYQFTQSDDGASWEDSDNPRRNTESGDTIIVSRSNKVADILNFLIVCHGNPEGDGDSAEANYRALLAECEAARLFTTSRGRRGAQKTVQKAIHGQSTPNIWTIKRYHLERVQHSLGSLGLIPCRLMLVCVEGIPALDPFPAPARFTLVAPTPTVVVAPTAITPPPAVFTLVAPVPDIEQGSGPEIVPAPAVFTLVAPTPVVTYDIEVIPPPAVFTLVAPVPDVLSVSPSLLADYDIDALGLTDMADIDTIIDQAAGHDAFGVVAHKPVNRTGGPNGKRYAHFTGSQIAKTTDTDVLPSGGAERIVFVVTRSLSDPPAADYNIVQYGPNGSGGQYFSLGTSGGNYIGYFWSSTTSTFDPGVISDWHIIALQINPSGNPTWWLDGVKLGTDTGVFPNTGAGTVFSIGGNGGAGNGDGLCDIARVKCYSGLTDGEIGDVFTALQAEYAL